MALKAHSPVLFFSVQFYFSQSSFIFNDDPGGSQSIFIFSQSTFIFFTVQLYFFTVKFYFFTVQFTFSTVQF